MDPLLSVAIDLVAVFGIASLIWLWIRFRRLSVPREPRIESVSLMRVREIDRMLLWRLDGEATDSGFKQRIDLKVRAGRTGYVRVYDGPYSTRLFLTFARSQEPGGYSAYFEIQSQFFDGRTLTTRNAIVTTPYPNPAFDSLVEFPEVISLRVLLGRHLERLAAERSEGRKARAMASDNVISQMGDRLRAHARELVQTGHLRLAGRVYRPSREAFFSLSSKQSVRK